MNADLDLLKNLLHKRSDEIEKSVVGTGYLARTVIGVGTYLLDNEGDLDLLSDRQKLTFERFILPLLGTSRRMPGEQSRTEQSGTAKQDRNVRKVISEKNRK